jgi:predicted O-methyltransferase YrrM
VILDDFGFWEGCRTAFYDFCLRHGEKPLLERIERDQAFWIKGRPSNRVLIPNLLDTHERENLERQQFHAVLGELEQIRLKTARTAEEKVPEETHGIDDNRESALNLSANEDPLGMISSEERAYLAQFARTEYSGDGAIVDLGCWLGASTIELARGLRENPCANLRGSVVHAYDCFVWEAWMDQFVAQTQLKGRYRPGDSFYEECVSRTHPWRDSIELHPGDLSALGWNSGPIEFLFIDAMKSWALANSILNNFFSALIPGRSIVVHQDFAHFGTHWIHLIMYRLRSYFEPVLDIPHSWSMVFRYREAIPARMLVESYSPALFSTQEMEAAFEYSSSIVAFEKRPQIVGAKVMALLEMGEIYHAREELERAKAANLCYADLHLPLGLWFPAMIINGFENEHKANKAMRRELEDTRASLQQARELIETMQRTKLWKLRGHWFRLKRALHLPGWETE